MKLARITALADWSRLASLCGLIAVLALQASLLTGSWHHWDLRLWDGSWYFGWARDMATSLAVPRFENAPVYCAYYAVFHLIFDEPYAIYFAHRTVMLVLISVLGFALFRRLLSPFVALLATAYLMSLIPEEGLDVYAVRHFVLVPLLVACHAALGSSPWADGKVLFAYALAAGVRPEYGLSFPLLALLLWIRRRREESRTAPLPRRAALISRATSGASIVASIALVLLVTTGSSQRSWLAFGQHFAAGYGIRESQQRTEDPWLNWQRYLKPSFGDASSVGQALLANPAAVVGHVAFNARNLGATVDSALLPPGAPAMPLLPLLAFLFLGGMALARRRGLRAGDLLRQHGKLACVLGAALTTVLLTSLVIAPRPFHMNALRLAVLLAVGSIVHLALGKFLAGARQLVAIGIAAVIGSLLIPTPFDEPRERTILPLVQALDRLPLVGSYGLVAGSATSYCNYARRRGCRPIEILWLAEQPQRAEDFIRAENVRVLVTSPRLIANLSSAWRSYLQRVVEAQDHLGWRIAGRSPMHTLLWRPIP